MKDNGSYRIKLNSVTGHRTDDQHGLGSNPLAPFCCVLGKDTLRHFPLLGGLDKQF